MQRRDLIKLNQFIKVVQQPLPYNLRLNTHAVYSKAQQKAVTSLVTGNGLKRILDGKPGMTDVEQALPALKLALELAGNTT